MGGWGGFCALWGVEGVDRVVMNENSKILVVICGVNMSGCEVFE